MGDRVAGRGDATLFLNKGAAWAGLMGLAVALLVFRLIGATALGKSLRAAADDPEAATYMGIDVNRAHRTAFGIGTVIAGVAGGLIVLSHPVPFRLRGSYFALAMLAYPLMLAYVFAWLGFQERSIPLRREGAAGFMQLADTRVYVALAVGLLLAAALVCLRVERSRFGLALAATKQNELAAEAAGIDTFGVKMRAMVLSGGLAAAAGGLCAVVVVVVTLGGVFGLVVSAQAMIIALFGGAGTLWGPLIGAAVLVPLGEVLQAELGQRLPGIQGVLYGVAVIAVVLLAPEGIFWTRWCSG